MFLKQLVETEFRRAALRRGQFELYEAGYFQAAQELAIRRADTIDGKSLEQVALQRAFIEGYHAAITDLYNFEERFVRPVETPKTVVPDYGAVEALKKTGQITEEEARELVTKRSIR